jgi:hypothetical protein
MTCLPGILPPASAGVGGSQKGSLRPLVSVHEDLFSAPYKVADQHPSPAARRLVRQLTSAIAPVTPGRNGERGASALALDVASGRVSLPPLRRQPLPDVSQPFGQLLSGGFPAAPGAPAGTQ